jgi:hypothetical protein
MRDEVSMLDRKGWLRQAEFLVVVGALLVVLIAYVISRFNAA